ncbi:5'/3'-nucleotidase SurE [Caloramator sp. E03]|uniref:5'/3'-nucleotidase SurE n=1 Tax=Caloramator sp. E03 TaxID=2576307 RepID=UPI0011104FFB|nr:5'/3'-nucleotidase SurE [Caloramator sp. E03]QCX32625.1 5'/3'-nucleotidase SurE [Caloramator sp. E03]
MRILITNDDGINSPGLHTLVKQIEEENDVIVVAPSEQRSASGHSLTLHRPLVIREVKIEGIKSKAFSVDGTPVDCVKIAIDKISSYKFDKIISGINQGYNLGTDVIYSGTVSAAIEGAIYKIPSIAVSLGYDETLDFQDRNIYRAAAEYAKIILRYSVKNNMSEDIVLNINVPPIDRDKIKGIKVCQLGNRIYQNCYIESAMEDGTIGYSLTGTPNDIDEENTDVYNIKRGFVTVTPLHYDLTNFKILKDVSQWFREV